MEFGARSVIDHTILLVDDEEDTGAALARLLRGDGYKILRAKSASEGLALLAGHEVGVVVSDQRMPKMTGVEFLAQVKELYPHTICIVLSGYADLEVVVAAINQGIIYKFFNKPWDDEILRAEILDAFRYHDLILEKANLVREIQKANDMLAQVNMEWEAAVEGRDRQIERISNYHPLTGLPNRQLFLDRLEQILVHAQRDNSLVAVILVNLDRFKQINDSFGHHMGDALLRLVAERLKRQVKTGDTIAHLGGDEFGFVMPDMASARATADVAQRLIDSFVKESFHVSESDLFVSACIGISLYPLDGIDANTLVKNAHAALHHAKAEGRGSFQYYAIQMNASARQQLAMETELRRALERNEFELYYQPKVALGDGAIIGMEALIRWKSPHRGLVSPGEFIPLLEETGLILPVGEWVLRAACKQMSAWHQSGLTGVRLAVNISAMQFRQANLAEIIQSVFKENGLDPGQGFLELELTESLLVKNVEGTIAALNRLHEMGIQLSIDDFGTGYSSLSYLKRFPISTLKIDQSFVCDLSTNRDDAAIVNAIIALGHGLGLKVIAEGVETIEQLDYLRTLKCDEIQGYLFSRPVPADEMTRLLRNGVSLN